jgi:hypothetical protein
VTWQVPSSWIFVLLTLAAYRLLRFISWDSITEPARAFATGRHETGSGKDARDTGKGRKTLRYRPKLDEFLHCPFCTGWWVCVLGFLAWQWWPHAVEVLAVPWAASGVVGLISKVLDA